MTEVLDAKIEGNLSLETYNFSIESELLTKRQRKRNKMPDETADDKAVFSAEAVSYTHLDVYKRQVCVCVCVICGSIL